MTSILHSNLMKSLLDIPFSYKLTGSLSQGMSSNIIQTALITIGSFQ
jgi:hypothetical protein